MLKRTLTVLVSSCLCLFAVSASAQFPESDEPLFDARVLDVNSSERTITVEIEQNSEIETYPVAEDAEFYTHNGIMPKPADFSDLRVGQDVALEFDGVEGEPTLRKITSDSSQSDS